LRALFFVIAFNLFAKMSDEMIVGQNDINADKVEN
jgi:hypothetical protein